MAAAGAGRLIVEDDPRPPRAPAMQPRANAHPSLPAEVIDLVDDDEDFLEPVADKPLAAPGGVLERRAGDFGQPLPSIADPLQLIDLEDDDEDFQRAVANSLQDQPQQAHRSEGKRAIRESQLIDLDSMNPLPSSSSRPAPAAASGRRRVYGNILDLEDDDEEKSPSPPASALYVSLDSSSTSASSSSSTSSFSSVSSLVDLIVSKHGHGRVQVEAAITTLREAGMGLEQLQDANGIDTVLDVLANEGADAEVECSLCADSGPARKTVVCTGSEAHRICADCASHYISDCKKFATGGPACPSHVAGCDGFYPEGALRRLATPEAFEKMQETMLQRTIVGENYLECPRCHNPSFRDEGAGAHWAHQCPYDGCRTTFCATCREPVAGGQQAHVCRANVHQVLVDETMPGKSDEEKIVAFNKEVIALVKGADALECPRCRKLVLKDEGCNAITCACGCHICWYCGKDTGISHGAHVQPTRPRPSRPPPPPPSHGAHFFSAIDPAVLRRQKRLDEIVSTVKGRREEAWLKKLLALPTWKADKDLKQLIYDPEGAGHDKLNEKASRPRAPAPGVIGNADAARLPPGAFLPLAVDLQRLDERVQAAAAQVAAQLAELDRRLQEIGEGQGQAAARQRAKLQRQRERIAQVQAMQAAHRQAHQAAAAGRQAAVAAALAGGQAAAAAAMAGLMGRRAAAAAAAVAAAAPAAPANPEEQARRMDEARRHVRGAWRNAMEEQLADLVRDVERQRAEEAALRAQDGRGAARRAKELAQQRQASERRVEQLRAQIRQLSARFAAAPAGGAGGAGGGAAGAAAGGAFPLPSASPAAAPAAPAAAAAAAAAAARPAGKRRREAPPPPPPEEEEEEAEVEDPMEVDDAPPARPRKQTRGKAPA
eukprot:tig00000325_g24086.t1